MLLDDTVLPGTVLLADGSRLRADLSPEELREACRALRGSILRQEIYGLDGTDRSDRPYSASECNYTLEVLQPQGPNRYGVFLAHPRDSIDFNYERTLYTVVGDTLADPNAPPAGAVNAADPRVSHAITLAVDPYGNVLQSASIGYGRRFVDPALTPTDQARQLGLLATCTESTYTNPILADDSYRTPLPAESSTYELIQLQPDANQPGLTKLFGFDELRTKISNAADGAHDIAYEDLTPTGLAAGEPYRRLIARARTYYRPDDLGAAAGDPAAGDPAALLPIQEIESLALPGIGYTLAFTPGLLTQVYQRGGVSLLPTRASVLGSVAADGGGYVDVDGDGHWWLPSGRAYFLPALGTAAQEKTAAEQNFYLPRRFEDVFGNAATADYDTPNDLLVVATSDAAGNTVTVDNDYRVLAPAVLTDPDGNRRAVAFDALGLVAGTAVMGKTGENLGDSLTGFAADLSGSQIAAFYAADDPHTLAAALLGNATTRVVYDAQRFYTSRMANPADPSQWDPVFAATLARETHVSDLGEGQASQIQIGFGYSDGYGRVIQKKVQAEPGPVVDQDPVIDPRWVGSGWTIFNNKGKPVRQYEPFFSQLPTRGHQFEYGVQVGVSPVLCYDPVERVVATLHPNHSYDKVVFDPWHQQSWDVNDTVLQTDPTADPDVGEFFTLLPAADYSPTWYTQRADGSLGAHEMVAASRAAAHANTPTAAWFDALGRPVLTVADNGSAGRFPSRVDLDIQGNQRAVRDAIVQAGDQQGRIVMRYDYDMLKRHLHRTSMEAGERWTLNDAAGKAIRAWDSRGHNFRTEYDALRRPTGVFVQGADAANSDPRTTAAEILYERIIYGEGQPPALNARGRIFQHANTAGIVTNTGTNPVTNQQEGYDFKGNPLRSSRGIFADYTALPDLTAPPPTPDVFASSTQYDALNRPIAATAPDGSIVRPSYNEANLLETVTVNLRGGATAAPFVTNIDYDAKGQRVLIAYGNNTSTAYTYDPLTFRLSSRTTSRTGFPPTEQTVQDLSYTYDPVGNITHIQDDADIHDVVFFRNQRVEPSSDYTYDATYRLILASGREQLGLTAGSLLPPAATSYNDAPRIGLLSPSDGNAMGRYTERYEYDAVGNFLNLIHKGANPANPGWTRTYTYGEASLLETGTLSNRISSTAISGSHPLTEPYTYDLHGSMTSMPQLQAMLWDFKDELLMTRRQAVNATDADGVAHQGERTYYVYDAGGQRARKVTESAAGIKTKERFYLGGFEVYREYGTTGSVTLERQTLHVMDDKQRVALVETRTQGNDGSPSPLIRYQYSNHLGSASLELDDVGQIISYEEYYPYGGTSYQAGRSAVEVALKRYRYTGMERDEESGLSYHGARYYASWLGRWTSCDPSGLGGGMNLYSYGADSPVLFVDPSGNEPRAVPISEYPISDEYRHANPVWRNRPTPKFLGHIPRHVAAGSKKDAAGDGGRRSPSKGGPEGKPGGLEGGIGNRDSTATKYSNSKYTEEGAGDGLGGLGNPGDVGPGTDVGTGSSATGGPIGTGTETSTGDGQASGGKPGGKAVGSKDGSTDTGKGDGTNPGHSSLLGDLAALASLLADPESLYTAQQSGKKGTGSQFGSSFGIISGWLAQVLVVVLVFGSKLVKAAKTIFGGIKNGLASLRDKLFRSAERKALTAGGRATVDDVLQEAIPGKISKPGMGSSQYRKPGGFSAANDDFDLLTDGLPVKNHPGGIRTATLPDTSKITVRPNSGQGLPTLEINPPVGNPIKVRYKP
jgi:RHS repeat-associated protein